MAAVNPALQTAVTNLENWFKNLEKLYVIVRSIAHADAGATLREFAATPLNVICVGAPLQCSSNKKVLSDGCLRDHIIRVALTPEQTANLNQTFLELLDAITVPVEKRFLLVLRELAFQGKPECHDVLQQFETQEFADIAGTALLSPPARADFLTILNTNLQSYHLPWTPGTRRSFDTPGRKLRDEIHLLMGRETLE